MDYAMPSYLPRTYIIIFILIKCISAEYNSSLCCPPERYFISKENSCWDRETNDTAKSTLNCTRNFILEEDHYVNEAEELVLIINSSLNYPTIASDKFCVARIMDENQTTVESAAILCLEEEAIIDDEVYGYCLIVSVIFLAITAGIYSALPELRDLQGKSIICFCISLCIGMMILVIMKIMDYSDMNLCATRGFLAYFFIMASFFWSNVISIQILKSTREYSIHNYGIKEFLWYSLYAWGCPTLLTICMATVNFHPGDHEKPGIGLNHCWFIDKKQSWYYMYSVMTILIAINICIFTYTSAIIWRSNFTSSYVKAIKYKLMMTIRLFVIMGLPWIFEMISSLAERHIFFVIVDVLNTLQGFLIFLLLVMFRQRTIKIMYKHGWLNCVSTAIEKHLAQHDDEENVIEHTDVQTTLNDL